MPAAPACTRCCDASSGSLCLLRWQELQAMHCCCKRTTGKPHALLSSMQAVWLLQRQHQCVSPCTRQLQAGRQAGCVLLQSKGRQARSLHVWWWLEGSSSGRLCSALPWLERQHVPKGQEGSQWFRAARSLQAEG